MNNYWHITFLRHTQLASKAIVLSFIDIIKTDFTRFAEMLETTRHRLNQAGESIDSAVSRTRTIQRRLSGLETGKPAENPPLDFLPQSLTIKEDESIQEETSVRESSIREENPICP
jgi:DNA anti-recombination protein RmuC